MAEVRAAVDRWPEFARLGGVTKAKAQINGKKC
jgi:hypothetical protein